MREYINKNIIIIHNKNLIYGGKIMSKHPNHEADIKNANKGMKGQNKTHAKAQGHRGWQKNPQNPANQKNNSENKKSEK